MLLREDEIEIRLLYMGRGYGCKAILVCEMLGVDWEIPGGASAVTKGEWKHEIDQLVFQRFRSGQLQFEENRQAVAEEVIAHSDRELIERAFSDDLIRMEFTRLEMKHRGIFDADLWRLGEFGNASTRSQAAELMKQKFLLRD